MRRGKSMSSPALDEIQRQFWDKLKSPMKDARTNLDLNKLICGNDEFTAIDRLSVYQTTARSLHVSVLEDIYSVCKKILGEDYFNLIAKKYYFLHSSKSPDLNEYGEQFPAYISSLFETRDELKDFLYLSDLAKLEWSIERLRYSFDAETLDIQELRNKCDQYGGQVKFSLIPGLILLQSVYPIVGIWRKHQPDTNYDSVDWFKGDQLICVYRDGYNVELEIINKHIYDVMNGIQQNLSLAEIIDRVENSELLNDALAFVISKNWLRI